MNIPEVKKQAFFFIQILKKKKNSSSFIFKPCHDSRTSKLNAVLEIQKKIIIIKKNLKNVIHYKYIHYNT